MNIKSVDWIVYWFSQSWYKVKFDFEIWNDLLWYRTFGFKWHTITNNIKAFLKLDVIKPQAIIVTFQLHVVLIPTYFVQWITFNLRFFFHFHSNINLCSLANASNFYKIKYMYQFRPMAAHMTIITFFFVRNFQVQKVAIILNPNWNRV